MDPDEKAVRCGEVMSRGDDAARELGIRLKEIRPGQAVMDMEITASMANGNDVCHGGLLFTLADTAMAFASNSRDESIEFLAPAHLGDRITALATEEHRAGRTATYSVAVTDAAGERVAQLLGRTYRVSGSLIEDEEEQPKPT